MRFTLIRQPRSGQLRLGGFITASLAAHWLALTGWTNAEPDAFSATPAPMAVRLLPSEASEQTIQAKPLGAQTMTQAVTARSSTATTTEEVVPAITATETAAQSEQTTALAEPSVQSGSNTIIAETQIKTVSLAEAQEGIRNRLKDDLGRHFKYPRLAHLRNWEGTVLLDLQIETDGKISRVTLAQSSGYAMLDDNAIATLNHIGNVRGAQQWLEGRNMELQLPVIYRLSDG